MVMRYLLLALTCLVCFSAFSQYGSLYEEYSAKGWELSERKEYRQADYYYSKLIELDSSSSSYWNRGFTRFEAENYDGCIVDMKRVLAIDPYYKDKSDVYKYIGESYLELNMYDEAITYLSHSINTYTDRHPEMQEGKSVFSINGEAYVQRALAKRKKYDYKDAISDYNAIIDNPIFSGNFRMYQALTGRADCEVKLGMYYEGIFDCSKVIEVTWWVPDEAYTIRASGKLCMKDYRGAIDDANRGIKLDSTNVTCYFIRGTACSALGNYKQAMSDLSKAIRMSPTDASAYYNRGLAKNKSGDVNGACYDFSRSGELGNKEAYDLILKYCTKTSSIH